MDAKNFERKLSRLNLHDSSGVPPAPGKSSDEQAQDLSKNFESMAISDPQRRSSSSPREEPGPSRPILSLSLMDAAVNSSYPISDISSISMETSASGYHPVPAPSSSDSDYRASSCYRAEDVNYVGNINFIVNVGPNTTSIKPIEIIVSTPNDVPVPFEIEQDSADPYLYNCRFQADDPGWFNVTVCHKRLNFHLYGSPFVVPVSRKYDFPEPHTWMPPQFTKMLKAWGIAYSRVSRRVYLADYQHSQIVVFDENGKAQRSFGRSGPNLDQFSRPIGIAVDNLNHRLVVTDNEKHCVFIYTFDGVFIGAFGRKGSEPGEFNSPCGVAVSPRDGMIAVADQWNHRIQMFTVNGYFLRQFCALPAEEPLQMYTDFCSPRGICFDITGENIYVTDFDTNKLFKMNIALTKRANMLIPSATALCFPQGVAVDLVGNILVCDTGNNCIRVFRFTGELISTIPGGPHSFSNPYDLIVVSSGLILVLDINSKITIL